MMLAQFWDIRATCGCGREVSLGVVVVVGAPVRRRLFVSRVVLLWVRWLRLLLLLGRQNMGVLLSDLMMVPSMMAARRRVRSGRLYRFS